jgi:WS/DGAT/MGAT family acyltransferase
LVAARSLALARSHESEDGPVTGYVAAVDTLSKWGTETELTALETLMWRAEVDRRLRSPILGIELLDRPPDWDRLVAAHEWGVQVVPRARQKIIEPALGLGRPVWATDADFDLHYHLRRVTLPSPGTMTELLELAQTEAMRPFDRNRPPWEATLVDGLDGGRAAFITKAHHSLTDGLGSITLMSAGRSRTRAHTPDKPTPAARPIEPPPDPARLLVDQIVDQLRRWPRSTASTIHRAVEFARQTVADPQTSIEDTVAYGTSLARILSRPAAPHSPLLAARSGSWRFLVHDVPVDDLKSAAKTAGGSLNDAYIAALLGAFRLYHRHFGVDIETMPVAFPISLRRGDDPMGGNRFAGARFSGPVGEADPVERIQQVRAFVLNARAEPAVDALNRVSSALIRLPTPVMIRLATAAGTVDLQASNIPGVAHPIYLAGARVTHMYPFGPLPGCAAMAGFVSHGDTCCIGVNTDAAAIAEQAVLADCLTEGFDEVLALARNRRRGRRQ